MATQKRNSIMRGTSGTVNGEVVFRQRNGETVICKRPRPYPPKTPTQLANQDRFKRANDFAKNIIKDPEKKAYYQSIAKPGQTAFNAAFQDAYHKPAVTVTTAKEKITIKIEGKHRVQQVKVGETDTAGTEMKTANAVQNKDTGEWEYVLPDKLIGRRITVWVYDVAGNICKMEAL